MTPDRSLAGDDRGVSEVIGYVLVVSLVITTVGVVSVSGIGVLQDAREAEQIENAKRAFDLLADNMEDIYREGAPSRSTEIQLGSAQLVAQQTTTLNVSWVNSTGDRRFREFPTTAITYRGDGDQRLIYDSGAVFRLSEPSGSGTVLRDPPFVITGERVVLAVPQVTSQGTSAVSGSTALIRKTRRGQSVLQESTAYDEIWINVTSPHWRAWRTALGAYQNIDCPQDDPAEDSVSCQLLAGSNPNRFYLTQTQIRVALTR
jgi:hypothetical protein